eukprot:512293_1
MMETKQNELDSTSECNAELFMLTVKGLEKYAQEEIEALLQPTSIRILPGIIIAKFNKISFIIMKQMRDLRSVSKIICLVDELSDIPFKKTDIEKYLNDNVLQITNEIKHKWEIAYKCWKYSCYNETLYINNPSIPYKTRNRFQKEINKLNNKNNKDTNNINNKNTKNKLHEIEININNPVYRSKCDRKGKHEWNSLLIEKEIADPLNKIFGFNVNLKYYDIELYCYINENKMLYGISIISDLHVRNRICQSYSTILNNNISNIICQECILILMYDEMFIYEILPSISYMLHSETTGENKDHILQFLCNSNFNHHGRLDDEVFVFNMIQKKNYSVLLQPILQLDFQDVNSYCGNILRKIASIGCGEQLLSNPLLVKALNEKIKHEKIESFLKLQTWSKVDQKWYNDSMIVSVNNGKWVKIHYDGRSDNDDEWHNLHNYQHCSEIKFNENSYEYLQTIRYIFIRLNVNQRIRIIKKGYFKNLDVYCRTFIMGTLDFSFIEMFENYAKRWKIINKYMSVLVNRNIIEIFDQWIHDNEYDFTAIINDINQYENTQSVILSSMKKILSWNKARCDSFFCILKLILIVEVFDFDDEYIQKCMIDMIRKYYNNNISIFPSIPSTNYFRNYFRIVNKFTKDDSRYESWMHVDDSEEQNEWLMEYDFISMKKVRYKKYSDEMYRCKKKKKKTSID